MTQKPKRKTDESNRFPKRIILGCGVALLLVLVVFGGGLYWLASSFTLGDSIQAEGAEAREGIEDILNTPLPESATEEYLYYSAWQDWIAYIRFSMPSDEVEPWLEASGLCFELPLAPNVAPYGAGDNLPWWQADDAEVSVGGSCGSHPFFRIFVDQTNPATSILYLVIFTT